jgi:hypothetical protein
MDGRPASVPEMSRNDPTADAECATPLGWCGFTSLEAPHGLCADRFADGDGRVASAAASSRPSGETAEFSTKTIEYCFAAARTLR